MFRDRTGVRSATAECYPPPTPTIAALAAILEKPTPRRPSPFVHLKAGSEKPPIFIAHGLCGTVQFTELAKHIRTDWIRAKARFELSMLLVRTKTAGQKGAFAHDDYRM